MSQNTDPVLEESAEQPAAPIGHSLTLPCPLCGELQAGISVNLWRLGDDNEDAFTCAECNNEFSASTIKNLMTRWAAVFTWLSSMPENVE